MDCFVGCGLFVDGLHPNDAVDQPSTGNARVNDHSLSSEKQDRPEMPTMIGEAEPAASDTVLLSQE
jgi:hypothetical protein